MQFMNSILFVGKFKSFIKHRNRVIKGIISPVFTRILVPHHYTPGNLTETETIHVL